VPEPSFISLCRTTLHRAHQGLRAIECEARDGKLLLTGTTGQWYCLALAIATVKNLCADHGKTYDLCHAGVAIPD